MPSQLNVKRFKGVEESLDKLEDKVVCTSNVTTDETLCTVLRQLVLINWMRCL